MGRRKKKGRKEERNKETKKERKKETKKERTDMFLPKMSLRCTNFPVEELQSGDRAAN